MNSIRAALFSLLLLSIAPAVWGLDVPEEGSCPPYPVEPGQDGPGASDVLPPHFSPGDRIELGNLNRLEGYLPPEVWQRRETFFYEGMKIEVGPCHRRYPAPEFFVQKSQKNHGHTAVDEDGNLTGYSGEGLPFDPSQIDEKDPDAGRKWAWNYRYRYQGSGFRGAFRIIHLLRRGRKTERFEGDFFLLPLHGYPGAKPQGSDRFWAGGRFEKPAISRGIAWRQLRKEQADQDFGRSDDVWVWLPDARKVRRSAQAPVEGIFMPSYTRAGQSGSTSMVIPGSATVETPGLGIGVAEHIRRGFVGLMIQPNAYRFHFMRVRDVLAPINSQTLGYPLDPDLSYGPSGLSVAHGRWEIRRAVVLRGERKEPEQKHAAIILYIDALTQAPLYMITRKPNESVKEVGIFVSRFTGGDPLAPDWVGKGQSFGTLLPVAQSFFVAGEEGWLRESFELRSDPPDEKERSRYTTMRRLQRGR